MGILDIFKTKARNNYNLNWTIDNQGTWVYTDDKADAYIEEGYKALPNVYSIISSILDKTTIVPFTVNKVKSLSSEKKYKAMMRDPRNYAKALRYKADAYEEIQGSGLEALLLNPNEYQSIEELWAQIDGYKMLTGNSYLYNPMVGSTGELHCIPSPCVDIKVSGSSFDPEFKYKVNYLENPLDGEDVIHFKYFNPITSGQNPTEQFKGQSPLQSCRLLLGRYKDADLTQGFQFKNMGPAGMITGKNNTADGLTGEQAVAVQDRFRQQHQGSHNAGDIMVTPSALTWTSFGLSPVDLNIREGKREMLGELCNAYKYPIALMNDTSSTDGNMIESRKQMITDAVIPIVEARKGVLNKFLAPKFGKDLRIEFDYSIFHEMQDDISKQAEAALKMYWISPEEKRAMTGFDNSKDPNMAKFYFPSGLTSLEDMAEPIEDIDEDKLDLNS